MPGLKDLMTRLVRDERGATSIEYGLIAILVAVGALGAMSALGGGVSGSWGQNAQKVSDAMQGK